MTSPCSVTLNRQFTEPAGCARTARLAGPPPRPTAPPRPWKSVISMPWPFAHSAIRSCARWSARVAEVGPASFDESEYPSMTSIRLSVAFSRALTSGILMISSSTSTEFSRSSSCSNRGITSRVGAFLGSAKARRLSS